VHVRGATAAERNTFAVSSPNCQSVFLRFRCQVSRVRRVLNGEDQHAHGFPVSFCRATGFLQVEGGNRAHEAALLIGGQRSPKNVGLAASVRRRFDVRSRERDRCRARRSKTKPDERRLPTQTSIDRARSARSLDLRSLVRPPLGMLALLSRGACAAAGRRRVARDRALSAPALRQDASWQHLTCAYMLCTASSPAFSGLSLP
jgi:hypothetical protein